MLNPCLYFINKKLTIPTHIKETLEQPIIILNPHSKLIFSSNNLFTVSQPKILQINLPLLEAFINFFNLVLFPGLIDWVIAPNDWKHKITKRNFSKIPLQDFLFYNSVTRKIKDLQNLSNKGIHVNLPIW